MADMIVDAFMTYETIEELRKMNGEFIEKIIVYDWFSFHAYFVSREKIYDFYTSEIYENYSDGEERYIPHVKVLEKNPSVIDSFVLENKTGTINEYNINSKIFRIELMEQSIAFRDNKTKELTSETLQDTIIFTFENEIKYFVKPIDSIAEVIYCGIFDTFETMFPLENRYVNKDNSTVEEFIDFERFVYNLRNYRFYYEGKCPKCGNESLMFSTVGPGTCCKCFKCSYGIATSHSGAIEEDGTIYSLFIKNKEIETKLLLIISKILGINSVKTIENVNKEQPVYIGKAMDLLYNIIWKLDEYNLEYTITPEFVYK